jgi:DNA ligase-associated metallophosphoesterase
MTQISWQNQSIHLLPEKAIFYPEEECLFIADPHFGKAATFRKVGIPVSEHTTQEDCNRLQELVRKTNARKLIFLGDFLHAKQGKTAPVRTLLFQWRELLGDLEIILIRGNHDIKSGDPWPELEIQCVPEPYSLKNWDCRHHPVEDSVLPYLAGHIHPGFSIQGSGRAGIRAACFWVRPQSIILPSFGSFTGLMNITPRPKDKVFLTNNQEIVRVT